MHVSVCVRVQVHMHTLDHCAGIYSAGESPGLARCQVAIIGWQIASGKSQKANVIEPEYLCLVFLERINT